MEEEMPAAGSPALCAAEGNFCYEGNACGKSPALCAAEGNYCCEGDACGRVAGTSCSLGQLLLRG